MPSLRCLISTLTQAGRGDLLFRFLVQFNPAAGRAGHCRQISLCVGGTRHVPATLGLPRTGVSVLSPSTLLRLLAALYGAGPALSAVPVFGSSTKARIRCACVLCLPRPERFRQPEAWRSLHGCGAPFPSAAPARAAGRVSGSLSIGTRGLFAVWEGVASLGLSFPLSPPLCLLPLAGMGRLFSGVSQSLCFANSRQCVRAG